MKGIFARRMGASAVLALALAAGGCRDGGATPVSPTEPTTASALRMAPLSVGVDGPYVVNSETTYSWEAMPSGGTGSYTYSWDILWLDSGQPPSTNVSISKVLSMPIFAADGEFILTARAYSGGAVAETSHMVCNFIYPNEVSCT